MTCYEVEQLLDEYIDGQLSKTVIKQIRAHLRQCQDCAKKYEAYEQMHQDVSQLGLIRCPENVVTSVYQALELEGNGKKRALIFDWLSDLLSSPAFALRFAGAVIVIVLLITVIYLKFSNRPQVSVQYTNEEVEQAKNQVKLTLAYINQITSRTEDIIEKQVLPENILKPMKSSIRAAFKPLFNGGES